MSATRGSAAHLARHPNEQVGINYSWKIIRDRIEGFASVSADLGVRCECASDRVIDEQLSHIGFVPMLCFAGTFPPRLYAGFIQPWSNALLTPSSISFFENFVQLVCSVLDDS